MTWAVGSQNPILVCPSVKDVWSDFGFTAGAFGATSELWQSQGAAAPAWVTGEGEQLGQVLRLNKTANNASYVQMAATRFTPFLISSSLPNGVAIYARVKAKTNTGQPILSFHLEFYDGANTLLTSAATNYDITIGTTLVANNTWQVLRYYFGVPTLPAGTAGVRGKIGFLTADTNAADVYVDWAFVGYPLDFADLGPYSRGVFLEDKFPRVRVYERRRQNAVDGSRETQLWNTGLLESSFKMAPTDDAGRTTINNFVDYVSRGNPFSFALNQTDLSKNFIQRAIPASKQKSNGIKQLGGTPFHKWDWAMQEVI